MNLRIVTTALCLIVGCGISVAPGSACAAVLFDFERAAVILEDGLGGMDGHDDSFPQGSPQDIGHLPQDASGASAPPPVAGSSIPAAPLLDSPAISNSELSLRLAQPGQRVPPRTPKSRLFRPPR
jgi:hypothetical protein